MPQQMNMDALVPVEIARRAEQIGIRKSEMDALNMFILAVLAVWLIFGAHTTVDKISAMIFPITAFVAAGFEHSIANMYFIPIGLLIKTFDPDYSASLGMDLSNLTLSGFLIQ